MADVTKEPVVLTTVPSEIEAVLIVEALRAYGINGRAVGGYASGFKVGAPGEVAIVVERDQLDEAKKAIAEIEEKRDRGRLAREASGADSWSESAPREKACIPPGRIIAVFAVIGALAGLLVSLFQAFVFGNFVWGEVTISFVLVRDFWGRIPGILLGAFGGSVIGLIAARPDRAPRPEEDSAGRARQRLVWVCVLALALGGIGHGSDVLSLVRNSKKAESTTATARAWRRPRKSNGRMASISLG